MKRLPVATSSRFAFWTGVLLLLYLSYRYPLQINFSGTSQAYSDTPAILQVPKFLIGLAACAILAGVGRALPIARSALPYVGAVGALAAFAIVKAVMSGEGSYSDYALWTLVALTLTVFLAPAPAPRVNRLIAILLYFCFAVDVVQILLFFTIGRLPALAWDGTFSVRFGSFLDDPNGFSVLCFLFLGWAWMDPSPRTRRLHVAIVVVMILAAQSLTALGFLAVLAGWRLLVQPFRFRGYAIIAVVLAYIVAAVLLYSVFKDAVVALYEFKQGSIDQHASFRLSDVLDRPALEWLVGSFTYKFFESWWIQAFFNLGLPWLLCQFGLAAYTLHVCIGRWRRAADAPTARLYFALAMFQVYFMLGAVNLPFYTIFPVNFLYQATCFAIILKRLPAAAGPSDVRAV